MTMSKAAFCGTYHNLRPVIGRKLVQVVVEIPIERMADFVSAFGAPSPDTWIALARMDVKGKAEERPTQSIYQGAEQLRRLYQKPASEAANQSVMPLADARKHRRTWDQLTPAQQAGIRCNEEAFIRFLTFTLKRGIDDPAMAVRDYCGVESRAHIVSGTKAEQRWNLLESSYQAWLHAPEQIG